jgi:hypothetical protein
MSTPSTNPKDKMPTYLYTCPVTQHKYVVEILKKNRNGKVLISGASMSDRSLYTYRWVSKRTVSSTPMQ